MAVAELTAESTHEEIKSFVDDIDASRRGDGKSAEGKSDAQITSEHADNIKTDNTKTENKTAAGDKPGDETADAGKGKGEAAEGRDWFDDDLKAEITAHGIDEKELADFTSREEVQRAMRFFDKSALEAGRKAMAEGEQQGKSRDDKGRFSKGETETGKQPEGKQPDGKTDGRYEVTLDKSVYDDKIVEEFTRMRDHYESRLETLESRFFEADAKAEEQHFDSLVDALGHVDLFGKTQQENAKQLQRRQDLHVAVKAQMLGLQALGRPTEMSESLVNRVVRMVFAEDLGKKDLKTRTAKITKQSNGRQGGGATRSTEPRETSRDEADRMFRELVGSST
jgi:hypothetical protein